MHKFVYCDENMVDVIAVDLSCDIYARTSKIVTYRFVEYNSLVRLRDNVV